MGYPVKGYLAAMGAEGHSIESVRMTSDQIIEQVSRSCRGCEGRGWRMASSRRTLRVAEVTVRLERRACPDCAGHGVAVRPF
jgi:DnaJ-class molecular chaperone